MSALISVLLFCKATHRSPERSYPCACTNQDEGQSSGQRLLDSSATQVSSGFVYQFVLRILCVCVILSFVLSLVRQTLVR